MPLEDKEKNDPSVDLRSAASLQVATRAVNPLIGVAGLADRVVTAGSLIEGRSLFCIPCEMPAHRALAELDQRDFDLAPLADEPIVRYVERDRLRGSTTSVEEQAQQLDPSVLVPDAAPLSTLLKGLSHHPGIFVLGTEGVRGIVTRADLQLSPVSLYVFGLILAIEAGLDRQIRACAGDHWRECLTKERLKSIMKVFTERSRNDAEIDLLQCLNLDDRVTVVARVPAAREAIGLRSRNAVEDAMKDIKRLRNTLAHGDSILDQIPNPVLALERITMSRQLAERFWEITGN